MRFVLGLTIGILLTLIVFIWKGLAFDFDLIPTTEQADHAYWLKASISNTRQALTVEAQYMLDNIDHCDSEEPRFTQWGKERDCWVESRAYFIKEVKRLNKLKRKYQHYCDEYFGISGTACSMYIDMYRS